MLRSQYRALTFVTSVVCNRPNLQNIPSVLDWLSVMLEGAVLTSLPEVGTADNKGPPPSSYNSSGSLVL